jgi:hypothetical protein
MEDFSQRTKMFSDFSGIIEKVIKYIIEGMAVGMVAYLLPRKKMSRDEVLVIGLTAAAVFAILDLFAPLVGASARAGAGFAAGVGLTGPGGIPMVPSSIPM